MKSMDLEHIASAEDLEGCAIFLKSIFLRNTLLKKIFFEKLQVCVRSKVWTVIKHMDW